MSKINTLLHSIVGLLLRVGCVISILVVFTAGTTYAQDPPSDRVPTFGPEGGSATAVELAASMDIPESQVASASLATSDPAGTHVFAAPLSGFPTQGGSFAALSSGNAANAPLPNNSGSLSTILEGLNTSQGNDLVQLTLTLSVPEGAAFWAIDWKFLSEEFPEYVGSPFNDAFLIETPASDFIISGASNVTAPNNVAFDPTGQLVTINTTGAVGMSVFHAAETTYDGATGTLVTVAPIPPGATQVTIVFSVMDLGDSIYDTTVFLDNFRFTEGSPTFWEEVLENTLQGLIEAKMLTGATFLEILEEIDPWLDALSVVQVLEVCAPLLIPPMTPAGVKACTAGLAAALAEEIVVEGFVKPGLGWMAEDPPDPNFTEIAILRDVQSVTPPDDNPHSIAWAAYITALDEQGAIIEALMTSFERLLGAAVAGEPQYMLLQAQALQQYWDMLYVNQVQLALVLENYATEFGMFIDPIHGEIAPLLVQLSQSGFDNEWLDLFQELGLTEEEIQALSDIVTSVPPTEDFDIQGITGLSEWTIAINETVLPAFSSAYAEVGILIEFLEDSLEVPPTNQPPIFDVPPMPPAGAEFTVNAGDTVSFPVQASDPNTGDMVGIDVIDLPVGAGFSSMAGNPASGTFSWAPTTDQQGVYIVLFTATDNHNVSALPTSIVIVVQVVNQPPVANAGGTYEGDEGETITLDASGSYDPDPGDSIVLYEWDLDADGEFDDAAGVAPEVVFYEDGTYPIELRVTDTYGESDTDAADILVNNVEPDVDVNPVSQEVQYSDHIVPVTLTATDVAEDGIQLAGTAWSVNGGGFTDGLFDNLTLADEGCSVSGNTNTCTWTLSGIAGVPAGEYTVRVTVEDDEGAQTDADIVINVSPENGTLHFHGGNPVALKVIEGGGNSGSFELTVDLKETYPDSGTDPQPGDIGLTEISMQLVPVGSGGGANEPCATEWVSDYGYDAVKRATCSFTDVPVNTYIVQVTDENGYYVSLSEDVLVVYDPSLGYAAGFGSFFWPDTAEETNFGFTMEYTKKGTRVKGRMLLIRHFDDGSSYRVRSNALYGLALGEESDYGWASFSGKATYLEPSWPEAEGNYEFLIYVEDRGEIDADVDKFWMQVKDKKRIPVAVMSMDLEAPENAICLEEGDIIVPYQGGKDPKK